MDLKRCIATNEKASVAIMSRKRGFNREREIAVRDNRPSRIDFLKER